MSGPLSSMVSLIRAGVAPDHQNTKRVTQLFDRVSRHRHFHFYLNVEVGKHLSHAELLAHHHAVLYAVGAPDDRRLAKTRYTNGVITNYELLDAQSSARSAEQTRLHAKYDFMLASYALARAAGRAPLQ